MFYETVCCDEHPKDKSDPRLFRDPIYYFSQYQPSLKILLSQSKEVSQMLSLLHKMEKASFVFYKMPPVFANSSGISNIMSQELMQKIVKKYGNPTTATSNRDMHQQILQLVPQKMSFIVSSTAEDQNIISCLEPLVEGNPIYAHWIQHLEDQKWELLEEKMTKEIDRLIIQELQWENNDKWLKWFMSWPNEDRKQMAYANALRMCLVDIPRQLLYKSKTLKMASYSFHHDNFSSHHYERLADNINRHRAPFTLLFKDKSLTDPFFRHCLETNEHLVPLCHLLPSLASVVPESLMNQLYAFLLLEVLVRPCENWQEKEILADTFENYTEALIRYLETVQDDISQPYSYFVEKTRDDSTRERKQMMTHLKEMTDETRKTEMMFKSLKIGDWNVGKEVFVYNKSNFDAEIEQAFPEEQGYDHDEVDGDEEYEGDGQYGDNEP